MEIIVVFNVWLNCNKMPDLPCKTSSSSIVADIQHGRCLLGEMSEIRQNFSKHTKPQPHNMIFICILYENVSSSPTIPCVGHDVIIVLDLLERTSSCSLTRYDSPGALSKYPSSSGKESEAARVM